MPNYRHQCDECGQVFDDVRPMAESGISVPCPECGASAERLYAPARRAQANFHTPIEMYSVAPETPDQLVDLRRKCPDVEFNDLGVPLAHNRAEKLRILKATGFQEK